MCLSIAAKFTKVKSVGMPSRLAAKLENARNTEYQNIVQTNMSIVDLFSIYF